MYYILKDQISGMVRRTKLLIYIFNTTLTCLRSSNLLLAAANAREDLHVGAIIVEFCMSLSNMQKITFSFRLAGHVRRPAVMLIDRSG